MQCRHLPGQQARAQSTLLCTQAHCVRRIPAVCFHPLNLATIHQQTPCSRLPPAVESIPGPRNRSHVCSSAPTTYAHTSAERLVLDVAGEQIILETGEIGRQANGAIMATMGETVLYATACCGAKPQGDGSFLPLSVHYQERFSAAGKTSASFLKREGRPRDDDVLVARLVDRPLRPMFDKGWCNETQILEWVMSYDGVNQPEPLAVTAAAAALLISDIPLTKAVAGVRVGYLPSTGFVINPTAAQMSASQLDLMMAGTADAVLMIEGFCDWLSEDQMLQAVAAGHAAISAMCHQLTSWAARLGKPKRTERVLPPAGLNEALMELAGERVEQLYKTALSKDTRAVVLSAVQRETLQVLQSDVKYTAFAGLDEITLTVAWKSFESDIMRRIVLRDGIRSDGRSVTEIRPITSRCAVLPRTHGSSLFTRGETQALCVATLGSDSDAQKIDGIRGDVTASADSDEDSLPATAGRRPGLGLERFYLQYFFPPSSVGECGRVGPVGRRELGHGELAQRALSPAVPPQDQFPYTVRVESTITESNGSSSMASVCGGCLAMLDAGVPLMHPVAGIAMGLILEPDGTYVVLSDILGSEDALGDMDFKVAGSAQGISAFQMDIKVEGITLDIMRQALAQAAAGRSHILQEMEACDPAPRRTLSTWAPKVAVVKISTEKLGLLIGPGGKTIRGIVAASGATDVVTLGNSGSVQIIATSEAAIKAAKELIELQLDELQVGTILRQRRVENTTLFGLFVELAPGKSGLVHLSELAEERIVEVPPQWKPGSLIDVMYLGTTPDGKTRLSHKGVLLTDAGKPYVWAGPTGPSSSSSSTERTSGNGANRQQQTTSTSSSSSQSGGGRWYSGNNNDGDVAQPRTPRSSEGSSSFRGGRGGGRGRGSSSSSSRPPSRVQ